MVDTEKFPITNRRPRCRCSDSLRYPVTLPERKGSFCVSTVSIVCGPTEHLQCWARVRSTAVVTNGTGRTREVLPGAGSGPNADAADGADGIFERRAHPDYSISGSAFTTEGNVDAERSKKCLRPAQVASEDSRILGPTGVVSCLTGALNDP